MASSLPTAYNNVVANLTNAGKDSFYQQVGSAQQSGLSSQQVADKYANNPYGVSYQELLKGGSPGVNTSLDSGFADRDNQIKALLAQTDALNRQIANQGRLLPFDISGAYSQARSRAQADVNPYYDKKINDYIAEQNRKRTVEQENATRTTGNLDTNLGYALEASDVSRGRTAEDTTLKTSQLADQQDAYQADTGKAFEVARNDLGTQVANAGLTTSGLGAQQTVDQVGARNVTEGRQNKAFNVQKQAAETFKSRTFDDLARGDTQNKEQTAFKKESVNLDLKDALAQLDFQQEQETMANQYERAGALVSKEAQAYQNIVNNFLASQYGKARAQDLDVTRRALLG